jgi:aldehyde:ferredoxin oxidoreductase
MWKGQRLDWNRYNEMLSEYYELHGWDRTSGWQTKKGLEKLGLLDVARKLEAYGKLLN